MGAPGRGRGTGQGHRAEAPGRGRSRHWHWDYDEFVKKLIILVKLFNKLDVTVKS